MPSIPSLSLNDTRQVPQIGLGLWKIGNETDFNRAFEAAVQTGYRHFDTAQAYGNEQFLGNAWHTAGLKREDIWLTSKIRTESITVGHAAKTIPGSLERLQTDYVDLLLLHFPAPLHRKSAWRALEAALAAGQAKSIGVSNYSIDHLEDMRRYENIVPAVNQVEMHVFLQQPELLSYCQKRDIRVEAYSPLAHGRVMNDPVVAELAQKYGKSYAQIMLRWCVQKNVVLLPKSITPSRIKENIDIFDFKLTEDEMKKLVSADRKLRTLGRSILFG